MRRHPTRLLSAVVLGLLLGWAGRLAAVRPAELGPGSPAVNLELITNQLNEPVFVTHAGDGSGRLFVVERKGRVVILRDGVPEPTPFLDIRSQV